MKKLFISFIALLSIVSVTTVHSYSVEGLAGDWKVNLELKGESVKTGSNTATINVTDSSGKAITGAKVTVYYSMKAMAGMPPMNFKTKAKADGNHYIGAVNLTMGGKWDFKIKIKADGKSSKAKMSVQVN